MSRRHAKLPQRLSPLEYPGHFEVRLVSRNSGIRWRKRWVCVTHTLAGEQIEDHNGRFVRKTLSPMSPD